MIFAHLLLGIIFGQVYGNSFWFVLGFVFPDIDHLYVIARNKIFSYKKLVDSIKNEKKYKIRYKTPLVHSLFGLVLFSLVIFFFNEQGALFFALAYFFHLLIDWLDIDEKYYLYPCKIKFNGFFSIWSRFEQIATIIMLLIIATLQTIKI